MLMNVHTSCEIPMEVTSRSKFACVRCRRRKSKCSGDLPCRTCADAGTECTYPRKPKRVLIYDTELEELRQKIDSLREELGHLKAVELEPGKDLDLLIFLSSGSCELICWNMKQFMTHSRVHNDITISPDFSSFIEEEIYDGVLFDGERRIFTANAEPIDRVLRETSFDQMDAYLNNVVLFLNTGYLPINPHEFRSTMRAYYDKNGVFVELDNSKMDYFVLEMLMILTLGQIYSLDTSITTETKPFDQVPGLQFFKLVIMYLPSHFQIITFAKDKMKDTFRIIELYGLMAIYTRMLDKKNASSILTAYALQLCISLNLHKGSILTRGMEKLNYLPNTEYYKVFWSAYCINRFFTSRIGQPLLLNFKDIAINTKSAELPPMTSDEYSNFSSMKFYVELARIAELINIEIYSSMTSSRTYLNSILKILSMLMDWINTIPEYLKLDISTSGTNPKSRLIFSLHFNYLHHIYLTCIPIMLHFAKTKILRFKKDNRALDPFDFRKLPQNISNLVLICIKSSQITSSIFITLLRQKFLRIFGFTEIDYLYSTSLVFIICLILNIKDAPELEVTFDKHLEITLNILNEMYKHGNHIAGLKLNQILDLVYTLGPLLQANGYYLDLIKENYLQSIWNDQKSTENLQNNIDFDELFQDDDIFNLREEDLAYMAQAFELDELLYEAMPQ